MSPVAAATMKHFFGTICWHNILAECIDLPPHLVPARQLWPLSSLFLWDVYVYTCEDLLTNFIIIFAPVRLLCSVTRLGDFFTLGNYLKPVCIILDEIVWQFCKGVKILSCKTASEIFRQLLIDIGRLFNQPSGLPVITMPTVSHSLYRVNVFIPRYQVGDWNFVECKKDIIIYYYCSCDMHACSVEEVKGTPTNLHLGHWKGRWSSFTKNQLHD